MPEKQQTNKVDPVLKIFFFLIVISGLFTVLYYPLIVPNFPDFAKKYDDLRNVHSGPELLPLPTNGYPTLSNENKSGKITLTEKPAYVSFRTNSSRKYRFSANILDAYKSVTANLYKGHYPSIEGAVIATTIDAVWPTGRRYTGGNPDEIVDRLPHPQSQEVLLDSGYVYTIEILNETKETIGMKASVGVYLQDHGVSVLEVWGAFAGLLVFLYLCRIARLILKMMKMQKENA